MVSGQPRRDSGARNRSVRFGGMICTESDFSALQVESPTSRAVADFPGANWTLLMGLPLRTAGLPRVAPALIS